MEPIILLVVLIVLAVPISIVWLLMRAASTKSELERMDQRLTALEHENRLLQRQMRSRPAVPAAEVGEQGYVPPGWERPREETREPVAPPPVPPPPSPVEPEIPAAVPEPEPVMAETASSVPPPPPLIGMEEPAPPPPRVEIPRPAMPSINWEQFMGVKLFAWVGGLALFLGIAFFIKYSFDNNLVPPELRVAIGFVAGLGLLVGGVVMSRKQYPVLSQTLCATGVVVLYAVTFACRSIYHFEFFGPIPTFLLMTLITAVAFLLAVRLNAMVVAILGMLGGFLTPVLISTGQDNPVGLFGYIAILDAGLMFVALNRRWNFLVPLAAAGTVFLQVGWADKFFEAGKYFEGNKILTALAVLLGFCVLFLAGAVWAKKRSARVAPEQVDTGTRWLSGSVLGLVAVTLAFMAWFLTFPTLAQRPWLMFGFVFLVDAVVAALGWFDGEMAPAQPLAGLAVFGLLAEWTAGSLSNAMLNAALVYYFVFAAVHAAYPVWLRRVRGDGMPVWGQFFPPLALILVLVPIFKLPEVSFLVWPFVLLVDVLAIGLAVMAASLLPVVVVMVLTLAATGALIFKVPAELTGLPESFLLLAAFAVFFVAVSVWAVRKLKLVGKANSLHDDLSDPENLAAMLPAMSGTLPFLLLIMATLRLPLTNPSPVFGLALLLVVLLLGVAKIFTQEGLPAVALACVTGLECAWHFKRFDPAHAQMPLIWYLIFYGVFTVFPFLFLRKLEERRVPWATAALAGLPQFFLIHRLVGAAYPNLSNIMGLVPAAFAVPALLGLVVILKAVPTASPARMTQLAWFGGVALFFITLIFPIQFDKQWITIGWALEGAALLWLFHRVPHEGLRLTGVGLLVAAFARLAFNPAVLEYHQRSTTPIFNWYLYAYGVVALCQYAGARLLAPPRNIVLKSSAPSILNALGTVLVFLLLNIEIADFFSAPGSTLTFQFNGNFARDMAYSIAWALFALVLLVIGIMRRLPAARYSALGLLSVTILKLFFHDLASLGQLYRIGAFIGVAVIAMLASFAYQRFYAAIGKTEKKENENQPTPGASA